MWMIALLMGCEAEEAPAAEPPVAEAPAVKAPAAPPLGSSMPHCTDPTTGASEPCTPAGSRSDQLNAMQSQAALKTAIAKHRPAARQCYESALADDASLKGRLALEVAFTDGAVAEVVVAEREGLSDAVEACVVQVVSGMTADGAGATSVYLPFSFSTD